MDDQKIPYADAVKAIRENLHKHLDQVLLPGYLPNEEYLYGVSAKIHRFLRALQKPDAWREDV
jgi:hypothetical protein